MHFVRLFFIIFALTLSCPAKVEGLRTWTNNKNQNIQASLVRVFKESTGDEQVSIPVSTLSKPHQKESDGDPLSIPRYCQKRKQLGV